MGPQLFAAEFVRLLPGRRAAPRSDRPGSALQTFNDRLDDARRGAKPAPPHLTDRPSPPSVGNPPPTADTTAGAEPAAAPSDPVPVVEPPSPKGAYLFSAHPAPASLDGSSAAPPTSPDGLGGASIAPSGSLGEGSAGADEPTGLAGKPLLYPAMPSGVPLASAADAARRRGVFGPGPSQAHFDPSVTQADASTGRASAQARRALAPGDESGSGRSQGRPAPSPADSRITDPALLKGSFTGGGAGSASQADVEPAASGQARSSSTESPAVQRSEQLAVGAFAARIDAGRQDAGTGGSHIARADVAEVPAAIPDAVDRPAADGFTKLASGAPGTGAASATLRSKLSAAVGAEMLRAIAIRDGDGDGGAALFVRALADAAGADEASRESGPRAAPGTSADAIRHAGRETAAAPAARSDTGATIAQLLAPDSDGADSLVRAARALAGAGGNGRHQATLRLEPPELGQLRVDIRMHDHAMALRLEADSASVARLLESGLSHLRDALAAHGIRIDRAEITLRPASESASSQTDGNGSGPAFGQESANQQESGWRSGQNLDREWREPTPWPGDDTRATSGGAPAGPATGAPSTDWTPAGPTFAGVDVLA